MHQNDKPDQPEEYPKSLGLDITHPFSELADALSRIHYADAAVLAASVQGDIDARERAIFERAKALADRQRIAQHLADLISTMERSRSECYPDHPAAKQAERIEQLEAEVENLKEEVANLQKVVLQQLGVGL
jgi:ubiquinone biosynthesis protein UbiJ